MISLRHLGAGCMYCIAYFHTEHLLCVKHHMVFTLQNGGGHHGAFADGWIGGRELRYMDALFSILSTWLCILAPEQVAKQTHRVSLQLSRCIVLGNLSQSSLPQLSKKPGGLAVSGACLLGDRLLSFICSRLPRHSVRTDGCLGEHILCPLCKSDLDMGALLSWEDQLHT
jgi:hypothetical protein